MITKVSNTTTWFFDMTEWSKYLSSKFRPKYLFSEIFVVLFVVIVEIFKIFDIFKNVILIFFSSRFPIFSKFSKCSQYQIKKKKSIYKIKENRLRVLTILKSIFQKIQTFKYQSKYSQTYSISRVARFDPNSFFFIWRIYLLVFICVTFCYLWQCKHDYLLMINPPQLLQRVF